MVDEPTGTMILPMEEDKEPRLRYPAPSPPVITPRPIQNAAGVLAIAGILGFAFDSLCGESLFSIGYPLFLLLMLAGFVLAALREGTLLRWRNILLLTPPLLFCGTMVAVHSNGYLTFWNFLATMVLTALLFYYGREGDVLTMGFGGLLGYPWKAFGNALVKPAPLLRDAVNTANENMVARQQALPILRGFLLMVPILGLFLYLLSAADELFARMLGNIGKCLMPQSLDELAPHLFLVCTGAWMTAGGIVYGLTRREKRSDNGDVPERQLPALGFTETMMVLGSVAAAFAAFIAVQSTYFFGGIDYARSLGLNYATYARRGFWELVSVAVLTLTLVHCLRIVGKRDSDSQHRWFHAVGTLLVVFTLVLLASAMRRMHAYEAAWGATPLRLYVDGFILWLGVALCWFVATLWRWHDRFALGVIVCGFGYLISLNLINPDESVAYRNFSLYQRTGHLCIPTIYKLSEDAIPALCVAYQQMPASTDRCYLGNYLREQLTGLDQEPKRVTSFHFGRYAARQALLGIEKQLPPPTTDACPCGHQTCN